MDLPEPGQKAGAYLPEQESEQLRPDDEELPPQVFDRPDSTLPQSDSQLALASLHEQSQPQIPDVLETQEEQLYWLSQSARDWLARAATVLSSSTRLIGAMDTAGNDLCG